MAYQLQFTLNLFDSPFVDEHHVQHKDMSGYIWMYLSVDLT